MARLASEARAGFYPIPAEALEVLLERLAPPPEPFSILDPCIGRGVALDALRRRLGCLPENTFGVELDEGRAAEAKALLEGCNVLGPASFLGSRATPGSFSFVYANPPFSDELGGGQRCEYSFLVRATSWLRPGGVLAFVSPDYVAESDEVRRQLMTWFDCVSVRPFPEEVRYYAEVIVLGVKRAKPADPRDPERSWTIAWTEAPPDTVYHIPPGLGPKVFEKCDYTEPELLRAMVRSPLRKLLLPPPELPLPSPPLALATGHIALLLAAGHLDGIVQPEGSPGHVVRGTATKIQFLASSETKEDAKGQEVTREVYSEKIVLTVRAVDQEGVIHTYKQD